MRNKLTAEDVKAMREIIKESENPAEKIKLEKERFIESLADYINHKYMKKVISYNSEKEVFSVIDEKEQVLEILKEVGIVKV